MAAPAALKAAEPAEPAPDGADLNSRADHLRKLLDQGGARP